MKTLITILTGLGILFIYLVIKFTFVLRRDIEHLLKEIVDVLNKEIFNDSGEIHRRGRESILYDATYKDRISLIYRSGVLIVTFYGFNVDKWQKIYSNVAMQNSERKKELGRKIIDDYNHYLMSIKNV